MAAASNISLHVAESHIRHDADISVMQAFAAHQGLDRWRGMVITYKIS